ncbi:hypothetical protein Tco_0403386 [Tanacetum coccineum]
MLVPSSRVESSNMPGRKIEDLDADAEVTLVDETQEMNDDNLMFNTCVLEEQGIEFEKVVEEPVVSVATTTKSIPVSAAEVVTIASANVEISDELTLTQTLIEIKTAKPKHVTTAATTVTSVRPRAKGIIFHDQEEQKKDQVALDEEMSRNLEAQLQAELIKEERHAKKKAAEHKAKDAALIEQMEDVQARMDADELLAERLQQEEREQFTVDEQARMLVDLIAERKKFFAA